MYRKNAVRAILFALSLILVAGAVEAGGPFWVPLPPLEEPPGPLGPVRGMWIDPQYVLGKFTVDEATFPGRVFPLDLVNGEGNITSNFGYRYLDGQYDEHFGVDLYDIGLPTQRVYASASGTVTVADTDPGGAEGRWIEISHGNGWYTRYLHLKSLSVAQGNSVSQGQQIGIVGGSGYGSDDYYDTHLHFEIRRLKNGVKIPYDPIAFFTTYNTYVNDVYSSNSGYPYIPTKRRGDTGIWVYLVQDSLVYHGYQLTVDGIFGSQTETVVKQFQTAHGLVADGIVGKATWRELMGNID